MRAGRRILAAAWLAAITSCRRAEPDRCGYYGRHVVGDVLCVLYVQQVLRVPPGRASLLFPALNLAVITGSLTGRRLLRSWERGARCWQVSGIASESLRCLPCKVCRWLRCSPHSP